MTPDEDGPVTEARQASAAVEDAVDGYKYQAEQQALLNRLRRIEGQVRGIQRMVADDRYCVDILQQMAAITSGLQEVSLIVLRSHIEGCVSEAIRSGEEDELIDELMHAIRNGVGRWVVPPHTAVSPALTAEQEQTEE
jgi:DNA-binding FrmR family transcriptional regulator